MMHPSVPVCTCQSLFAWSGSPMRDGYASYIVSSLDGFRHLLSRMFHNKGDLRSEIALCIVKEDQGQVLNRFTWQHLFLCFYSLIRYTRWKLEVTLDFTLSTAESYPTSDLSILTFCRFITSEVTGVGCREQF